MLAQIADRRDLEVVLPIHLSPAVSRSVRGELRGHANVHLLPPTDYVSFIELMRTSDLVLTDSGGVQEEASALGVPVLVMRDATDRPEGVSAGCAVLAGTDPARVSFHLSNMLDDPGAPGAPPTRRIPTATAGRRSGSCPGWRCELGGEDPSGTGRFRRGEEPTPFREEIPA